MEQERPLKIYEYKKETPHEKKVIVLLPTKDGTKWKFVNLSKGYICPCEFDTREEALTDFVKYANALHRVEIEELNA